MGSGKIFLCFVVQLLCKQLNPIVVDPSEEYEDEDRCFWECSVNICRGSEECIRVGDKKECLDSENISSTLSKGCYELDDETMGFHFTKKNPFCNVTLAMCLVGCRIKRFRYAYYVTKPRVKCLCFSYNVPITFDPCTEDTGELFLTCSKYGIGVACERDCFCEEQSCCRVRGYNRTVRIEYETVFSSLYLALLISTFIIIASMLTMMTMKIRIANKKRARIKSRENRNLEKITIPEKITNPEKITYQDKIKSQLKITNQEKMLSQLKIKNEEEARKESQKISSNT